MKVAAGILGLIGGLIALMVGSLGYGLTSAGNAMNQAAGGGAIFAGFQIFSIVIPLIGLLGAGLAFGKAKTGAIMMGASATLMILIFGFHTLSLVPVALLGVGAVLAYMSADDAGARIPVTESASARYSSAHKPASTAHVGETLSIFKGKQIVKEAEGVSVDGVVYSDPIAAQIAITNGKHG